MNLIDNNPITADGAYDLPVAPGMPHLLTLKGDFGSGTLALTIQSPVDNATFESVDNGSWTASAEDTLIPAGSLCRFTLSGSTAASIRVTLIPIKYEP